MKAPISKSQRKRDLQQVFALGESLVALSPAECSRLPIEAELRTAIETARRTAQRGARKRQLKLVAALLRESDLPTIQEAFEGLTRPRPGDRAKLHASERWRERLLEPGDEALTDFIATFPEVDRQQLGQLQRNARSPRSEERGKRAAKALFQLIHALVEHRPA